MTSISLPKPIIQNCGRFYGDNDRFKVCRGDLSPGGIKCQVLIDLLTQIEGDTIVYNDCWYGHSGFALGMAGHYTNKKVYLYMSATQPEIDTSPYKLARSLNNVFHVIDDRSGAPESFAEKSQAHYLPIGFDCEPFITLYANLIRSLDIEQPAEVWVAGGSGVTARCLQIAWPNARVNVIDLGARCNPDFGAPYKVWGIPEKLDEEVKMLPPYPSSSYTDAKIWQIVKNHAELGAFIWNNA